MRGLKNKQVIITGAANGIGKACAHRFAAEGAGIVIFDRDSDKAKNVADEIIAKGGIAKSYTIDLTDYQAVRQTVAAVIDEIGAIDILVNCAGWDLFIPFLKSDVDYWRKIVDINLMSILHMHHAVLPEMVARKQGVVVNIASDAGRVGSSGEAVYAACKAGIIAFSKTMVREHARDNIRFNVVCPGMTETGLFENFLNTAGDPEKLRTAFTKAVPMGRIGEPDDIVGAIVFLASEDAAYITGQVLSVSGGLTMHG